ncbi:uncharacterized protein LOC111265973 isoform X2 [Varroa jacobsoni]|uniref:Winged helix-turn-helix domain-containing protein n=1 Tax=Varroa destructor TaxID=109461 RepID=A0A7M7JVA1_VARDE|nr:uncharacterized protein LOC111248732 isoform X2 [Varroa destructor]XP_022698796.1 uncharacterized protein LOC111265973 isoform X2 [Varroa jacobsoni]
MAMVEDTPEQEERIVMTPRKRGAGHTCIAVERVRVERVDTSQAVHVAGGQHQGIVINKENQCGDSNEADRIEEVPQLWLEFKVFLKNAADNTHSQESRKLKFWFKPKVDERLQMHLAQDFFKELVSPCEFPRDYVGFIKKVMKLLQKRYPDMRKVEVELKQMKTLQPDQNPHMASMVEDGCLVRSTAEVTIERILELIECAYPNAVTVEDIATASLSSEDTVRAFISELEERGVVRTSEDGTAFTRVTRDEHKVKRVRQMPPVTRQQQPTIAIITAQFCEKVAVDAMIDDKNTFVRYKTEGESNVYTLGNIGRHRVVATKLPAIGHQRGAMIAAGNTTTRLLGTFQNVDYVILVGCGGGVPHYTDYSKHVRLGDVVVSDRPKNIEPNNYIYMFAEKIQSSPTDDRSPSPSESFNLKTWLPPEDKLQVAARQVLESGSSLWEEYITEAQEQLRDNADSADGDSKDFDRPADETDKLYMSIGGNDVIEVGHPCPPEGTPNARVDGHPVVHFGAVASGEVIAADDAQRQEFAAQYGIFAFDSEFDSVVESVYGNRKDNYMVIRGIADYRDGTKRRDWQNYAALTAAAFMKAVVENLPPAEGQ